MGYQIDYIPVGDKKRSGDAIVIRYGNLFGDPIEQKVVVIDGGSIESGKKVVEHILKYYPTGDRVDYVFSTHLDSDHINGIKVVLENLDVGCLYMALPWDHAEETSDLYKKDFSVVGLKSKLQKSLDQVRNIQEIAMDRGVPIEEPFAGMIVDDKIAVLGPSKEYYESLTTQFRDTPEAKSTPITEIAQIFRSAAESVIEWVDDTFDIDLLGDGGTTSPENNSSLVLLFEIDNHLMLFTGDAGIPALTAAADFADNYKISLKNLDFFHVPHHGSRHNIGSTILGRIRADVAFVSVAAKAEKHPSKIVTNALYKKGYKKVLVTKGRSLLHHEGDPERGWITANPLPFYKKVDN